MTKMQFGYDEEGNEILIKEGLYQVMMAWEKPYMEACIDALQPSGDVLEVGFGLGYSSTRIQYYHPKTHTIIEYDPTVAARAREWAKQYVGITIIEKTWQEALPALGRFDAVFFDDYPLEAAGVIEASLKEAQRAAPLVEEGIKRMKEAADKIPQMTSVHYQDKDLEQLVTMVSEEEKQKLPRFFLELYRNQQISRAQVECYVSAQDLEGIEVQEKKTFPGRSDRLFEFLVPCLKEHMRIGARFSCYVEDPSSKYGHPLFEEHIILNPMLSYKERWIDIEVPSYCKYYSGNQALVITITKEG